MEVARLEPARPKVLPPTLPLIALLSLACCRPNAAKPGEFFGTTTPQHSGQTLFLNNGAEPQTIDPGLVWDGAGTNIVRELFEGLTRYDPKTLAPIPGMAERWEVSADGLTWTFHLRDAVWTDGEPVTANDFAYAWTRVLDPLSGAQYANMLWVIKNGEAFTRGKLKDPAQLGVRARDPKTLEVTLQYPAPYFLELTAYSPFAPVRRDIVDRYGDGWTRPEHIVTNGAFRLSEWRLRYEMVLTKNPSYWDAASVKLQKVVAMAIEDSHTALRLYETGTLDWLGSNGRVPPENVPFVKGYADYKTAPRLGIYFLWLQCEKKPLDDPRVRRALNLAIDREQLVQYVLRGGQLAADHLVPDTLLKDATGYVSPKGEGFDPKKAQALLAEAGYPGGEGFPELSYTYNTDEAHRQIAEAVQAMWREHLGIDVQLYNMEFKVHLAHTETGDFEIARGGWWADYQDPSTFLEQLRPGAAQNHARWSSKAYGEALDEGLRSVDPAVRNAAYARAEALAIEGAPLIPLYVYSYSDFLKPYVKGIFPNGRHLHPLRAIWIDEAAR